MRRYLFLIDIINKQIDNKISHFDRKLETKVNAWIELTTDEDVNCQTSARSKGLEKFHRLLIRYFHTQPYDLINKILNDRFHTPKMGSF